MFDAEMIRACAQMYPYEFIGLCVLMAVMIPIGAVLMVALATMMMEG